MASLRIIDAITPPQWRLSMAVRGGSSAYGLQFTLFRGELIGVMTARDGTYWWVKYDQEGFAGWTGGQILTWWGKGRAGVTVLDDVLFVSCIGGGDGSKNVYLASTTDLKTWKNLGILGSRLSPYGPALCAFDGRLFCQVVCDDTFIYTFEAKADGTLAKDWYKTDGQSYMSPSLVVWDNEILNTVMGMDAKLYSRKYTKAGTWGTWAAPGGMTAAASGPSVVIYKDNKAYASWKSGAGDAVTTMVNDGTGWKPSEKLDKETAEAETGMGTYQGRLIMSFSGTAAMKDLKPNL